MNSLQLTFKYLLLLKKSSPSENKLLLDGNNYLIKNIHIYMSKLFLSNYVIALGVALLIVLSFNNLVSSLVFSGLFALMLGFVIPVLLTLTSGIEEV